MSSDVRKTMDSIVVAAQSLLNEFANDDLARKYLETILGASQFIRDEMNLYMSSDGVVNQVVIASGLYARSPFALIENNVYTANHLAASSSLHLTAKQLQQLEQIKIDVFKVRKQLDEIWDTR